jgi:hypothetical protein
MDNQLENLSKEKIHQIDMVNRLITKKNEDLNQNLDNNSY